MRKLPVNLFFLVLALALPFAARAGVSEGIAYLKTQAIDDWSAQALAAAGQTTIDVSSLQSFSGTSATDYAKRILALIAQGKDPHTYTGSDLVAGLRALAQAGQLGDTTLLNDDAWGIIALRAAGVAASDSVVTGAKNFLLSHQGTDDGWGYDVFSGSDTNDTAAVLMALSEVGFTQGSVEVQNAVSFLNSQQQPDGGWPYVVPCFWPGCEASDSASTSWALSALTKLGITPSGSPASFIASLQTGDGSFKWQASDASGSTSMTSFALVALTGKYYPVKRLVVATGVGGGGSKVDTADIGVAVSVPSDELRPGESVSYTITLTNQGPDVATGVRMRQVVPAGVEYQVGNSTLGTFDPSANEWGMNALAVGASAQLTLTVRLPGEPGTVAGRVVVSAHEQDVNKKNNQADVNFVVKQASVPQINEVPVPAVLGVAEEGCQFVASNTWAAKQNGFVRVAHGAREELWYVDPVTRVAECAEGESRVRPLLEKYALGITNANLNTIPQAAGVRGALGARLGGWILLQVESVGEAWYVDPVTRARTYLPPTAEAWNIMRALAPRVPEV